MIKQGNRKSDISLTLEESSSSLQFGYSIAEAFPNKINNITTVTKTSSHLEGVVLEQVTSRKVNSSKAQKLINPVTRLNPILRPYDLEDTNVVVEQGVDNCISLNLDTLQCFESVELQYEELGVVFSNCIAIQPSNPAFPTERGVTVLMGAPKSGFLEASFVRPVNVVNLRVTSSQRLIMSAYNRDRQVIAHDVLPGANLANTDSIIPPNALLSLKAQEIYSISLCAFDGQFTIDKFEFSCD
ncbi:hypothetical protein NIES4101_45710 [Calothrix sp. NIES-4101]|nr:hypothetical protein NIES4101_45710 [Calothrix sp. NIES-4101]